MGRPKRKGDRASANVMRSALTGSYALAERGRETGRMFVIIGESEVRGHVYIADGRKRRLLSPKRKSLRHLTVSDVCPEARELLPEGKFTDGDIRRAISRAARETEMPKGESNAEG